MRSGGSPEPASRTLAPRVARSAVRAVGERRKLVIGHEGSSNLSVELRARVRAGYDRARLIAPWD